MRKLKNLSICPPDPIYFSYYHPETGHRSQAFDYYNLTEKYKEHRKANNLPIPSNYDELIQEQICSQIPPELCTYDSEGTWVNTRLNLQDVIDFTKVLIAHAANGGKYVTQEEAERRARICSSCYLNVRVTGCTACRQLADLTAGNRTTSQDSQLQSCAVCHCTNTSQIHFPLTTLLTSDTPEKQSQYPKSFCWKNKLSPNFLTEQ